MAIKSFNAEVPDLYFTELPKVTFTGFEIAVW